MFRGWKRQTKSISSWQAAGLPGSSRPSFWPETGWRVACVDPGNPGVEPSKQDLRSTAFLAPSIAALETAGLFEALRPHAAALQTMRILETAPDGTFQNRVDFDATEAGLTEFGFNIANGALRETLATAIATHPNAALQPGTMVARILPRDREMHVRLTSGETLRPSLVVAADGQASPLRDMAGIGVRRKTYGQKSTAFAVSHPLPHDNISTEIYCSGGPFTIVPLPGIGHDALGHRLDGRRAGSGPARGP